MSRICLLETVAPTSRRDASCIFARRRSLYDILLQSRAHALLGVLLRFSTTTSTRTERSLCPCSPPTRYLCVCAYEGQRHASRLSPRSSPPPPPPPLPLTGDGVDLLLARPLVALLLVFLGHRLRGWGCWERERAVAGQSTAPSLLILSLRLLTKCAHDVEDTKGGQAETRDTNEGADALTRRRDGLARAVRTKGDEVGCQTKSNVSIHATISTSPASQSYPPAFFSSRLSSFQSFRCTSSN